MKNPFAAFPAAGKWARRLGAIGAALLLAILIGGLVVGLILVHRGGTNTSSPAAAPMSVYLRVTQNMTVDPTVSVTAAQ